MLISRILKINYPRSRLPESDSQILTEYSSIFLGTEVRDRLSGS